MDGKPASSRMDGRMDGWLDRWMDGWMDGWTGGGRRINLDMFAEQSNI